MLKALKRYITRRQCAKRLEQYFTRINYSNTLIRVNRYCTAARRAGVAGANY